MKALYFFIIMFCFFIKNHAQNNFVKLIESQTAPMIIDGELAEQEWLDTQEILIKGITDREVTVLLKYDTDNLYIAFRNLTDSQKINLNAEVLINTNIVEPVWGEHCYWFHSSYGNCSAVGQYYYWENCTTEPTGWIANTFPFKNGNNNMEFKISFSELNMTPKKGQQLKIAFKLSDPLEQQVYWPELANIANPDTRGTITFN